MITERPDNVDPTVELSRDASGWPEEPTRTRIDLPRRRSDPTREDLPSSTRAYDGDGPGSDDGDVRRAEYPRRRRSRWRWVRRTFYLLVALVVGIPLAAGAYVWYIARQDDRTHSDAILVLGAAQFNGRPSPVLEWRLQHALNLYREGVAPNIMTVGGKQPGDNYTEAGAGRLWLNEHGVPISHLVAVPSGHDTLESMIDCGEKYRELGWHSAVIVTDPWHALRSRTMARDNGIEAVASPTRSGPTVGSRDTQFHYIERETGGYLYYMLIGRWYGDS